MSYPWIGMLSTASNTAYSLAWLCCSSSMASWVVSKFFFRLWSIKAVVVEIRTLMNKKLPVITSHCSSGLSDRTFQSRVPFPIKTAMATMAAALQARE